MLLLRPSVSQGSQPWLADWHIWEDMAHSIWMSAPKNSISLLKKNLFYVLARGAFWCYRHAPLFGALRASVGIIRNEGKVLVIRRNDGRGFSFPGGLAWPWETDEQALVREIREESGLLPEHCEFAFRYEGRDVIPAIIAVFHVRATGEVRGSWEGAPEWIEPVNLEPHVVPSQRYIVTRLLDSAVEDGN